MENKKFVKVILTFFIIIFNLSSTVSGRVIPICTDPGQQTMPASVKSIFNMKEDGTLICWLDERNNGSLYAQKIDINGRNKWAKNGVLLDSDIGTAFSLDLDYPQIFSNHSGGAIVVYRKMDEIFVQKVNNDGITLRMPINLSEHYLGLNYSPRAVLSKNNTITIAWENFEKGDFNIHAQRIDFNCRKLWNNGIEINVCDYSYDQRKPSIAIDESNYTIILWLDARPSGYQEEYTFDLYANRIDTNGKYTKFGSEGKLILGYDKKYKSEHKTHSRNNNENIYFEEYINDNEIEKEFFYNHNLVTSDNNSTIVALEEQVNLSDSFIRVIKINENLDHQWNKVINGYSLQSKPLITANNDLEVFLLWNDQRNYGDEVYGMLIDKAGNTIWGNVNGTKVSQEYIKNFRRILSSEKIINGINFEKQNIFLSWVTHETNQLFLSNINLATKPEYSPEPIILQNNITEGQFTSIVKQNNKIVVTYKQSSDILASINSLETTNADIADPKISIDNYPNPFNPVTKITFNIPKDGLVKLSIYDIAGKVIETLINEYKTSGNYNITFDGSNFSTGIYFCRIESNGIHQTKKMTLIK